MPSRWRAVYHIVAEESTPARRHRVLEDLLGVRVDIARRLVKDVAPGAEFEVVAERALEVPRILQYHTE